MATENQDIEKTVAEQAEPALQEKKPGKMRIFIRVLLVMLLLIVALPFTLYIPAVQDFVCSRVVWWLNSTSDDLEYQVGQIRIGFPLTLKIKDVAILKRKDGTPLLSVGSLQTGLDDIPWNQPYFVVNKLGVEDVVVGMDSLTTSFGIKGAIDHLELNRIEVDPMNSQLRVARVHLHEPDVDVYMGPSEPDSIEEDSQTWFVSVKQIAVHKGKVHFDMSDQSLTAAMHSVVTSSYFDYQHLDLEDVNLAAHDIIYDKDLLRASVDELAAVEKHSGLEVKQLALGFEMAEREIRVADLDMQLGDGATLKGNLQTDLALLDSLHHGFANTDLALRLDSVNFIRLAAPYLPNLSRYWEGKMLNLALQGRITRDSLDLRHLDLSIDQHLELKAEAFGLDPFDNENRSVAATVKSELAHTDYLLSSFVEVPEKRMYRLPDSLSIDLEAAQRQNLFSGRIDMRQHDEDVLGAEGSYELSLESYHLKANTSRLDIGQFIPSVLADGITLRVNADGRHFRFPNKWTRLEANMQVDSLCYTQNGHRDEIRGITAEASLNGGNYLVQLISEHPYLQMDTHLEGIYLKDTVSILGYINVPHVDLANLPAGLAQQDFGVLGFRSFLSGHYDFGDIAQAAIRIDSLRYDDGVQMQHFDSILITLESEPGMLYADLTGGDAALSFNTEKTIRELPGILAVMGEEVTRQLNDLRFDFNAIQHSLPQGQLDFHMAQKNPFYPAINYMGYSFQSIDMSAYNLFDLNLDAAIIGFRNDDRTLDYDSIIAEIRPCKYKVKADSLGEKHGYRLSAHALHIDPKARDTYDIHARGLLMPDSVAVDVKYVDGNYTTLYDAAASLAIGNDTVTLRLEKDPTLFAQKFTVNKDNFIRLMEYRNAMEHHRTHSAAKVLMSGPKGMTLDIYTRKAKNRDIGNQMLVRLQNLDLTHVSNTIKWDGDIGGRLNLSAMADLYPDSLGGQIRAGIKTFHLGEYKADTLAYDGRVQMSKLRRDVSGTLTIDSIVKMQLSAALSDTVNMQVGITELPLPLANLFMPTNISLSGTTSGKLTMRGKDFEKARMNAQISMHEASINVSDLDATLRLPEDTIRLQNNRLTLNNYNLYGVNKNPISLRGSVDMRQDLSNPQVDLRISGNNVQLIDSRRLRLKDQYIYGRLPITTDIRVKGKVSKLDVTGSLKVLSGTNLNYYLQDDPLQATSKVDQLVEFVSFRQMDRQLAHHEVRPLIDESEKGMSMEMKIDIDKDVRVNAFLPGTDNNHVNIVGGGPLVMQCLPDGMLTMSGVYDVTNGTVDYKLPILPMTKKFNILNSSMVSWNGTSPGAPVIDIKASENVRATVDDAQGSRLVNFVVTINITGTLDALDMTFTCAAPEDGSINSEIESMTEEERSKAALMLLVAQTYLGPGSSNDVGMGTANAALNSVLNRQMDQMLGSALKNTDVDLGIDTYSTETGNARTDYSIKVSQRFFNDRFRATLGGRVSSGGDPSMGSGARLGDMSLEWLIKKDGSHYLKLYRRYNYESVFEGEILESGMAYAQERQAYKFKHLLIPTSKSRQARLMTTIREMQRAEEESERLLNNEEEDVLKEDEYILKAEKNSQKESEKQNNTEK